MTKALNVIYRKIKPQIKARLIEFQNIYNKGNQWDVFRELCFCLLTPQSKAKSCWEAVKLLDRSGLLQTGTALQIAEMIRTRTRFHNQKALNLVLARNFMFKDLNGNFKEFLEALPQNTELREKLVNIFRGLGYKEASHFMRNVGRGGDLAILDRHILKNLVNYKIIKEIPKSMSSAKYLELEKKMKTWAGKINIPLAELDLLLWYLETGEVFK